MEKFKKPCCVSSMVCVSIFVQYHAGFLTTDQHYNFKSCIVIPLAMLFLFRNVRLFESFVLLCDFESAFPTLGKIFIGVLMRISLNL